MPRQSHQKTSPRNNNAPKIARSTVANMLGTAPLGHGRHFFQNNKSLSNHSPILTNVSTSHTESSVGDAESDASGGKGDGNEDDGNVEGAGSEDDDGDEEPEAFAPSDHAIHEDHTQTGLTTIEHHILGVGAGKKRKMRSSDSDDGEVRRPCKGLKLHNDVAPNSEDEGYDDVDKVGDSDEDDPRVERLEEKWIIDSEEENGSTFGSPIIPNAPSSVSSDGWPGFDLDGGLFFNDVPFFDEQIGHVHPRDFAADVEDFNSARIFEYASSSPSPPPRKVRFADEVHGRSDSTSSDDSNVDDGPFPDLFLQQDSLDPSFRQIIENDDDEEQYITDGEGSYLVFDDNVDFGLENHGLDGESSSSCGSSSGYETDEGETTDEEVLPPTTITRPQSLLRRESTSSLSEAARLMPAPKRVQTPARPVTSTLASRRQGPLMASWVVDQTKAVAVIDSTGKRMVIYPAQRPTKVDKLLTTIASSGSSSAATSPRNSFASLAQAFDGSEDDISDFSSQEYVNPMLGSGVNLMMPGLFHGGPGMEHIAGGNVLGPPEAFFPFKSIGADGLILDNDDEDDEDDDLDLEDFIDFGEDTSGEENDVEGETCKGTSANEVTVRTTSSHGTETSMSASAIPSDSAAQNLLDHFDRGVVTAFRRNQHRHQTLLRRPPINTTTTGPHGLKSGRHNAASTPISPLRKRKASGSITKGGSSLSGVALKRRVSNPRKRTTSSI